MCGKKENPVRQMSNEAKKRGWKRSLGRAASGGRFGHRPRKANGPAAWIKINSDEAHGDRGKDERSSPRRASQSPVGDFAQAAQPAIVERFSQPLPAASPFLKHGR
jgi:hypothetical protein